MAAYWRLALVLGLFMASAASLVLLVSVMASEHRAESLWPSSFSDLRRIADILRGLRPAQVYVLFASAYLFKQTFAVPGSALMNVLAGAVFGVYVGFPVCCALTATGATLCYALAAFCGRPLAEEFAPRALDAFEKRLRDNRHRLNYFLLFLRLFPMTPNWAINMSCGVLGVPVINFILTVLFGLMPYNFVCVQTGELLASVESLNDVFTWTALMQLSAIAFVFLLPGLVVKR